MSKAMPSILPEDRSATANLSCEQCELAHHGSRVIWGEGSLAAPLFVVLDNPGAREDREGVPFLCGTRETLQKAAYEAGFGPDDLYISYILKCRPRRAYDKERARTICMGYLWEQLRAAKPYLVMCLGNVVCQAFWEEPDISAKKLRGRVHSVKGYRVAASYHPLAVRRRPVLYDFFLQDWRLAAEQVGMMPGPFP